MTLHVASYSPQIKIFLAIGEKKIFLSDLLYHSARLKESVEVPAGTRAILVMSIDGAEESEEVVLDKGIDSSQSMITFCYADPHRINGRHFTM